MASNTPNIDLFKKNPLVDGEDTFNVVTMLNENWDKIDIKVGEQDKQITDCLGEIDKVKEQIAGIDVTTDVEEVVTRLVNTDKAKPLNTLTNEIKVAIINHVTSIKDAIVTHVTNQHTATKTHVTTKAEELKILLNSKPNGIVKSVQRGETIIIKATDRIEIPISTVNVNKSLVNLNGWYTDYSGGGFNTVAPTIQLKNSTTLLIKRPGLSNNLTTVCWEVVELY